MILRDSVGSDDFGRRLAGLVVPGDVITLAGPLGAGKTSIVRGLLAALGLSEEAPSPSFAIVQPYAPPELRIAVLHVDLYRIEDAGELEELGLDEVLSDSILIVEWPERAPGYWREGAGAFAGHITRRDTRLDSTGAGGMEGEMAADMTPPAGAAAFLAAHGWSGAEIRPVAGDASFRRYFRAVDAARSAILMDAPPPHEDPRPFIAVARWLVERGFAAPAIHGVDLAQGLVMIEDFGDVRMRETIDAAPGRATGLYTAAIDILIALRAHAAGELPPYDAAVLHRESNLLTEFYCPAVGINADQAGYTAAWDAVFDVALAGQKVTVLRDFHTENLMLIGTGEAIVLGLLDFQDALAGHPAYDLVSLLQDARRDVDPALEAAMLDRYKTVTGEGAAFDAAYHLLGAQRNAKIVGIFTRLWKRDGKPRYAALCPRVWRYLERDLAHPALAPVKAWFDLNIPPEKRGDPIEIGA